MSGRIIFRPEREHHCAPGWKQRPPLEEGNPTGLPAGTVTAIPPSASEFPVGCRWQCDDCGQVWIRCKSPRQYPNGGQYIVGGLVRWRRERWWERRRPAHPPVKGGDVE